MQITFYKNSSDKNVLTKDITEVLTVDFKFKNSSSILRPLLYVKYNATILTCNYCYIDVTDRYYYIVDTIVTNNSTLELTLDVDVLMSYRNYILNLYCLIDRQEFNYNPYIVDTELLTRADKTIITDNVGQVGVDNVIRYYLTTTGGTSLTT